MKAFLALLFVALAVTAVLGSPAAKSDDRAWEEYKERFHKNYATEREDSFRKDLFLACKKKVEEHNKLHEAGKSSYTMRINQLCDWTNEELNKLFNTRPQIDGLNIHREK